jgi:hypothetical protein
MLIPKANNMSARELKAKKAFIRQLPCIARGMHGTPCCEGIDPAHLKHGLYAGGNMKDHRRILPMCRMHHSLQGQMGEVAFWGDKLYKAKDAADRIHRAFKKGDLRAALIVVGEF